MSTTFAQLGTPAFIVDALAKRGITEPFEIQTATIADALAGRDVLGRAPTGSGKTLAFGVPLVAAVSNLGRAKPHRPTALILAPTRELAEQITNELDSFAGEVRLAAVYGGVGFGNQLNALRRGVDILVACPGRLEDLIERREVDLGSVAHVVLDEADRMADMGFMPAVKRLLNQTAAQRQTVLFSATLDGDVAKLTQQYQTNPVRHEIGEETPDIRAATHLFWGVEREQRNDAVSQVINAAWPTVVFVRTRHGADRLAKQLAKLGIQAASIHGNRSQNQRQRALDQFAAHRVHALVATDVAARGIHVDGVTSVIHYDPPADHKDYIHRSGRTARAGADGVVVSLVTPDQKRDVRKMIKQVDLNAEIGDIDLAPVRAIESPDRTITEVPQRSNTSSDGDDRQNGNKPRRRGNGGGGKHRKGRAKGKPRDAGGRNGGGQSSSRRSSQGRRDDTSRRQRSSSGSKQSHRGSRSSAKSGN